MNSQENQTSTTTSPEGHALLEIKLPSGAPLELRAMEVRKERTGLHAHVILFLRQKIIAHSTFNVFREEERTRLCNAAHSMFGEMDRAAYSKEQLRHDFGIFTLGLQRWLEKQWAATPLKPQKPEQAFFLLKPYLLRDAGTILFSPPGKGKSWIALIMAVSIDAGLSSMWPTAQTRVMFVNLERSARSLQRRLWQVNESLGLAPDRELLFVNARGQSLADLGDSLRESVLSHEVGAVFLDSISRAGMGALAEDRTANSIVDTLNRLSVAWFAIGHTPRQDDSHVYGSVHFEAGEDVGISMVSQESPNELGIGLQVVKANDIAKPPRAFYRLLFNEDGFSGIEPASESDFPELLSTQDIPILERLMDFTLQQPQARATTTEAAAALHLDPSNTGKLYRNSKYFRKVGQEGRQVFYGVIAQETDAPNW